VLDFKFVIFKAEIEVDHELKP